VKPPRLGKRVRAMAQLCIEYTGICLTTEGKLRKIINQGKRRALDCSVPNANPLFDLVMADDGLDKPTVPCRPWLSRQATGSNLVQLKYLPITRTKVSPHQLTLSQSSRSELFCDRQTAERPDPRVSNCYLSTGENQFRVGDTSIVTPITSGYVCGQRTSTRGTHGTSLGGSASYITGLGSCRIHHVSYSAGHPAYPSYEQPYF